MSNFYKKTAILLLGIAAVLVPAVALATPSSVDRITSHIEPLIKGDYVKAQYYIATSTTATSTFANGLNLTKGCLAYNGTCISLGSFITALTGDVTASGPGSAAATLATVNGNVGSFTNASITVNAKGLITAASSGSGGGSSGLATTSPIAGSNLLVYSSAGAGSAYGVATSTLTASGPLTGNFTQIGSGGSLGCTTASNGVAGCLNSSDWATFNGKQAALTATWPITLSGATLGFNGLSTSSPIAAGAAVLYATGVNTVASAATGTVSNGAGISVSAGQAVIGSGLTITNTGVISNSCPGGFLSCSGTNPSSFTLGTLGIANGGTNNTAYNAHMLLAYDGSKFVATSTPTVGAIFATSTATSTFLGGINLTGTDCFAVQSTCLQTYIQNATAYKAAANYATAAVLAGTPTYSNGTAGVGATLTEVGTGALAVDGQNPSVGQRVLIKNQADQTQNGVYTVTVTGSGIASYVLTRATDFNTSNDVYAGVTVPVLAGGTANGDTQWTQSTAGTITIGTSNIVFIETSLGTNTVTSLAAGSGISVSGSTGAVTVTNTIGYPFSPQTYFGATYQATSSNLIASSSIFINATTTNATSTNLYVSGQTRLASLSGLLLGTSGVVSAYGGASACSANNFVTTISSVGGTTCGTASISGVSLGSNLNSFSVGADFTGTSYNGSAAVSDWALKMSQPHSWTGLQTFLNASSSLFSVTGTAYFGGTATTTISSIGSITTPANSIFTLGTSTAGTLKTTSAGVVYADTSGGGSTASSSIQTFTSTGTWTKSVSSKYITIEIVGPGGGGAGSNSNNGGAGGGGAGGYCRRTLPSSVVGATETVTIGTGGGGGNTTSAGNAGSAASTFGSWCTANAGNGGQPQSGTRAGGTGGTATGGDVNSTGQSGQGATGSTAATNLGGTGGTSYFGGGGVGASQSATVGGASGNYGGGGGGAINQSGGNGANGYAIITEINS